MRQAARCCAHRTCVLSSASRPLGPVASTSKCPAAAAYSTAAEPVRTKMPQYFNNRIVEAYAEKSSTPISLKHLINFGKLGRNKSEADEAEKLLKSGNFLRTELPTRLSHRLRDLQSLPYIVASNPHIAHVNELYFEAFESIRKFPKIESLEDNDRFCQFMQKTLNIHRVVIPELAIGISESDPAHLPPSELDLFVTRMLRSRLSRRIITEQHIALTAQFRERQRKGPKASAAESERVGIVYTGLNPARVARQCADYIRQRPGPEAMVPIELEGDLDSTFSYIEEHLEFLLFELLKNAARATVAQHGPEQAVNYPIKVTIVHRAKDLSVRVSDSGGGLEPWGGLGDPTEAIDLPGVSITPLSAQRLDIFSFSHMRRAHLHHLVNSPYQEGAEQQFGVAALRSLGSFLGTVKEQLESTEDLDTLDLINRTGIGLPLARMYAEYLGGDLNLFTVQGDGSDVYLTISKFGSVGKA